TAQAQLTAHRQLTFGVQPLEDPVAPTHVLHCEALSVEVEARLFGGHEGIVHQRQIPPSAAGEDVLAHLHDLFGTAIGPDHAQRHHGTAPHRAGSRTEEGASTPGTDRARGFIAGSAGRAGDHRLHSCPGPLGHDKVRGPDCWLSHPSVELRSCSAPTAALTPANSPSTAPRAGATSSAPRMPMAMWARRSRASTAW